MQHCCNANDDWAFCQIAEKYRVFNYMPLQCYLFNTHDGVFFVFFVVEVLLRVFYFRKKYLLGK